MTQARLRCLTALLLAPAAAGGCADALKQPYPTKGLFGIEPGTPDVSATPSPPAATGGYINPDAAVVATARPTGNGLMLVRPVRVSPPYDGLEFTYRDGPSQYTSDYYSNFVAPPSALLTGGLTEWLDRAGPVPVIATGATARADYVLDAQVGQLVIDRTDRARPRAVIAARFFVTRESGTGTAVLSDTSYTAAVPVTTDDPAGYAEAWGRAYRQVLQRLATDLRPAIGR